MSKLISLVFSLAVVSICAVYADEDVEPSNNKRNSIMDECAKKFGITDDEIKVAFRSGDVDGLDPCFWKCCYRGTGLINEEGLYDLNATLSFIETKFHDEDSEDYTQFQEMAKMCEKVNNESVNDGETGCERAAMLVSCFLKGRGDQILQ